MSRRIAAGASDIFRVLADPRRHIDMDGSGMVRGSLTDRMVTGVGDVFVIEMYFAQLGHYEMNNHVVEYELDRRIGWEPVAGRGHPEASSSDARWGHRWAYELVADGPDSTIVTEIYDCAAAPEDERAAMDDGQIWIDAMTQTLERLDALCAFPGPAADGVRFS